MKFKINYFPVLDDEKKNTIFSDIVLNFCYVDECDSKVISIPHNNDGKYVNLITDDSNWNPQINNLNLSLEINYRNGSLLYGDKGIAPSGSEIGVCFEFYSQKARKRSVSIFDDYIKNDEFDHKMLIDSVEIDKSLFNNDIDMNVIVYLKKSVQSLLPTEKHLNNCEGVVLGFLYQSVLFVNGVGNIFPIYFVPFDENLLWKLEISYEDPYEDRLEESLKLIFNTNHKDFKYIDSSSKDYNDRLVTEIVSIVITTLVTNLREEGNLANIDDDNSFQEGSVIDCVRYFKNVLGLDLTTTIGTSESIRNYIDKGA